MTFLARFNDIDVAVRKICVESAQQFIVNQPDLIPEVTGGYIFILPIACLWCVGAHDVNNLSIEGDFHPDVYVRSSFNPIELSQIFVNMSESSAV